MKKQQTIGQAADKLAKKYGSYTQGFTVLQFALEKATGFRVLFEKQNGINWEYAYLTDSANYKEVSRRERNIVARVCEMPEGTKVVSKTTGLPGKVCAIRTTHDEISSWSVTYANGTHSWEGIDDIKPITNAVANQLLPVV